MPTTKEGLQRLLEFFVYGMLRAAESLGNAPLFLRTVEEEGLRKFLLIDFPKFQASENPKEACEAYTKSIDEGGLFVLGSGLPGTMKSTRTYAILHANARQRAAKGLYVSLEQTRPSLEAQMAAMGFDVEAVRSDVHILDVGTIQKEVGKSASKPWMEFLRRTMTTKKDIDGVDLVVIDSLEALEVLAKFEDRRTELFRLFEWLRDLGATTLVLAEAASEASYLGLEAPQPRRDETFLADGIIELKMHPISDVEIQRRIRVQKMRGSHHKTGFSALVFDEGRFQVVPVISP